MSMFNKCVETVPLNVIRLCAFEYWKGDKAKEIATGKYEARYLETDCEHLEHMVHAACRYAYARAKGGDPYYGVRIEGLRTSNIDSCVLDIVSKDTIWLVKTSTGSPSKSDTLCLLIQYIMSRQCKGQQESIFDYVNKIGIVNPRIGKAWVCEVKSIDEWVFRSVREILHRIDRIGIDAVNEQMIKRAQASAGQW